MPRKRSEMAVALAFCCLAFSAANDFVFKLFARKIRSRGLFVLVIGLVFASILACFPDPFGRSWRVTLLWGAVGGIFSVSSNLLLIETMSRQSAGLCSTIFRLNLAIVVPFAVLFFHETLDWRQWLGVILALLAVIAFFPSSGEGSGGGAHGRRDFILIILAAVLRAGMGLAYKYAVSVGASPSGVNVVTGLLWIFCGTGYYLAREKHRRPLKDDLSARIIGYGLLSGTLVAGITYTMAMALSSGEASIVLSIAQMSFLGTFFLSVVFLREKVTGSKVLALLLGVGALLLLSRQRPDDAGRSDTKSITVTEEISR